jgi:hypothetical protein
MSLTRLILIGSVPPIRRLPVIHSPSGDHQHGAQVSAGRCGALRDDLAAVVDILLPACLHIFIDFGQLCSSKPTGRVHGNRTAVFMISTTCFQAGQHP